MRSATTAVLALALFVAAACGGEVDSDGDGTEDVTTDETSGDTASESDACAGLTGGPCHVVEQCGCSGEEACQVQIDTDPDPCVAVELCLPRTGGLDVGDECERSDECRVGSTCLAMGMPTRHCFEWCVTDVDCTQSGAECFHTVNWTSPPDSPTCPGETLSPPYLVCTLP